MGCGDLYLGLQERAVLLESYFGRCVLNQHTLKPQLVSSAKPQCTGDTAMSKT